VEQLLDDYYAARGWDENGIPSEKKLKEMGLMQKPSHLSMK
jgi:aldehyde:ferredoxin oxidoreductase